MGWVFEAGGVEKHILRQDAVERIAYHCEPVPAKQTKKAVNRCILEEHFADTIGMDHCVGTVHLVCASTCIGGFET